MKCVMCESCKHALDFLRRYARYSCLFETLSLGIDMALAGSDDELDLPIPTWPEE